jgi:hypothetical protein
MKFKDAGAIFVIAAWLIATSSIAGFVLMRWVRTWDFDDDEAPEASA